MILKSLFILKMNHLFYLLYNIAKVSKMALNKSGNLLALSLTITVIYAYSVYHEALVIGLEAGFLTKSTFYTAVLSGWMF